MEPAAAVALAVGRSGWDGGPRGLVGVRGDLCTVFVRVCAMDKSEHDVSVFDLRGIFP